MHALKKLFGLIMSAVLSMMIGCDKNENARLAQMADEHLQRQAEQNRQMSELHREVAEGSRRLVEADAKARQEMVAAQRQLQTEHAQVGQQRDALENERREIALQRHREPIIVAAVLNVGLLLACLLPLALCWRLLHGKVTPADDQWFDETKRVMPDFRHRALRHHSDGIFLCEQIYGVTLSLSSGRVIPVRWIGEQHVKEDLRRIPTAADWLACLQPRSWMAPRVQLDIQSNLGSSTVAADLDQQEAVHGES